MGFFRKCSKFRRSIPLKNATKSFEMTLNTKHGERKKQNKTKQNKKKDKEIKKNEKSKHTKTKTKFYQKNR